MDATHTFEVGRPQTNQARESYWCVPLDDWPDRTLSILSGGAAIRVRYSSTSEFSLLLSRIGWRSGRAAHAISCFCSLRAYRHKYRMLSNRKKSSEARLFNHYQMPQGQTSRHWQSTYLVSILDVSPMSTTFRSPATLWPPFRGRDRFAPSVPNRQPNESNNVRSVPYR